MFHSQSSRRPTLQVQIFFTLKAEIYHSRTYTKMRVLLTVLFLAVIALGETFKNNKTNQ